MKTSETKKTTAKAKKVSPPKPEPDEESIRAKALEIYHERMVRGEEGTPEEDWERAKKALKKSKK